MPGEDVESALQASAALANDGLGTILTALGERIETWEEAERVRDHYLSVLDRIAARKLPAEVSVKLTHLGLDVDRARCLASVAALAERSRDLGARLWIDMEESNYVDATLALYRDARAANENVGVCLQSYLYRTPRDIEALLPLGPSIRLVKGAYREPAEIAYPKKSDNDAAYLALARQLLDGGAFTVFGTHDMSLLGAIRKLGGAPFEVHMLYGIKMGEQKSLAREGVKVRTLISYGTHWFPWYMRRLAERPANVWFVVKNLFG